MPDLEKQIREALYPIIYEHGGPMEPLDVVLARVFARALDVVTSHSIFDSLDEGELDDILDSYITALKKE
ncbi:MAG: hypothetical protein ACXADB_12915 [Candidatus Hermodarchaeia archaeon]|jgi:hypothetical protein